MQKIDTNNGVALLNKKVGETPLACIDRFRNNHLGFKKTKLSYAGRLDPMAEGLLIVLIGDENKKREIYQNLRKEYDVTVLLGIQTDTYDILGKITRSDLSVHSKENLNEVLGKIIGKITQPYPPYSSKPVNGKPLYYWSREGKLSEIEIPTKEVEIFSLELKSFTNIETRQLKEYINKRLKNVVGEFRQEEIVKGWEGFFEMLGEQTFQTATMKIECSSGTYMRSIANDLGGVALSIKRTKVGNFLLKDVLYSAKDL